jgi:hypothetical protein
VLGKGTGVQALHDGRPGPGTQTTHLVQRERALAHVGSALIAEEAATTGTNQRYDNVITGAKPDHPGSDLFDDTGGLVSIDGRQRSPPGSLPVVNVAVADSARGDLHLELTVQGRVDLDVLDDEGLAELVADGGLHTRNVLGRICRENSASRCCRGPGQLFGAGMPAFSHLPRTVIIPTDAGCTADIYYQSGCRISLQLPRRHRCGSV